MNEFHDSKTEWAKIKHAILAKYLPLLINKIAFFNQRINLVDGFAGAGRYGDGQPGSALISATIAANPKTESSRGKFHCINVEQDASAFAKLSEETKQFVSLGFVENIQGEFEKKLPKILIQISSEAALFFIDPFGTGGATTTTLERISKRSPRRPVTETLIRFDSTRVSRLLNFGSKVDYPSWQAEQTSKQFWKRAFQLTDEAGVEAAIKKDPQARRILTEGYIRLVTKELGYFDYGLAYPVINPRTKGHRYFLVHFCNHPDGYYYMANYMAEVQRTVEKCSTPEKEMALFGDGDAQLEIMEVRNSAIEQLEQNKVAAIGRKLPDILCQKALHGRTVERRVLYAAIVEEFGWSVLLRESKKALQCAPSNLLTLLPGSADSSEVRIHPLTP